MKRKIAAVAINAALIIVVLAVSLVGFWGGNAVAVSGEDDRVFYSGNSENGVSLMFNIYENAENVRKILDILDENGAKGTFFIGGSWADDNVDCVREIFTRGHEVASHGYFHKDHAKLNHKQNMEEILPAVKLVNMICNTQIKLFAPPSGSFSEATLTACAQLDLRVIMWTRDTIDWRDSDKNLIINRATKGLKGGDFVLMHPKDVTVSALPEILKYISDNGLSTVTVTQNIGE